MLDGQSTSGIWLLYLGLFKRIVPSIGAPTAISAAIHPEADGRAAGGHGESKKLWIRRAFHKVAVFPTLTNRKRNLYRPAGGVIDKPTYNQRSGGSRPAALDLRFESGAPVTAHEA
jgi:hypothetical protein